MTASCSTVYGNCRQCGAFPIDDRYGLCEDCEAEARASGELHEDWPDDDDLQEPW